VIRALGSVEASAGIRLRGLRSGAPAADRDFS
jgi:hypothetical protein